MEIVIPPCLMAIREVRWHMENNQSVSESVRLCAIESPNDFSESLHSWLIRRRAGDACNPGQTPLQKAFFSILERGLSGQPILESLVALEAEMQRSALFELDLHVARLPFLSMIPLFLFQFPAFLLLLLGPLLSSLIEHVGTP